MTIGSDTDAAAALTAASTALILKEAIWVEPATVVEVAFTEWTGVGILRHPSYKGQREDVDPREVVREVGNSTDA